MESQPAILIGPYMAYHHKSGLCSTIYKTKDSSSHILALKLTTPSQMLPPHNSHREARLLRISEADSIVPLLDSLELSGARFLLVFPFKPLTLGDMLDHGPLSSVMLKKVLLGLFSGLSHIHSLSIIHRDIKPSNLLLASPEGPICIADFGIAWRDEDPDSEPANRKITDVGTTCYRPPELLFGHTSYGIELDLWAAGCTTAECAIGYGRTLFDAGELGSELALIQSIFQTLGTPTVTTWPVSYSSLLIDADALRKPTYSLIGARCVFMSIQLSRGAKSFPMPLLI